MRKGNFVISLDFELFWGISDSRPLADYKENLSGVHAVVPKMLELFSQYSIHGTFSTVGFLFFENLDELKASFPSIRPEFKNENLSNYLQAQKLFDKTEIDNRLFFAPDLIKLIAQSPNQEVGTHTFSHYYCLEKGASVESFKEDILAAKTVMQQHDLEMTSLVFPRNQTAEGFLFVCKEAGILSYRGNEDHWIYAPKNNAQETKLRRALRLIDSYFNISGWHCHFPTIKDVRLPIDIPASRFLRPYSRRLAVLEPLRLNRIKKAMTYAAKNNRTYHLWWHPHNFGVYQKENLLFLKKILIHYKSLNEKYGFESLTMTELANKIIDERRN